MTETDVTGARTVAQAFYTAMHSQDIDTLKSRMADDIVLTLPGNSGISGTFRGHEAVLGLFGILGDLSEGTYNFDIRAITDGDGVATAVGRATASARGKDLDQEVVHVLDVDGDRVTSLRAFFGNQSMTDEFWS